MKKAKSGLLGSSLLVLVFAGLLAACSTTTSGGGSFEYQPYDETVYGDPSEISATVTMWHTLGKNNSAWLDSLVRQFESYYPNITIKTEENGDYDTLKGKLDRVIAAGGTELPTIAYCYPDHVADYLEAGAVIPLDDFVTDPVIGLEGSYVEEGMSYLGASDYVQSYWNEGQAYQVEGLYSLPWTKSTELLFYNQDLFNQNGWTVPATWEDMWDLCERIQATCAGTVPNWYAPLGYDSDSNLFITMCKQNGIPYTDNSSTDLVLFDNDEARAMVKSLKEKYDDGLIRTKLSGPNNSYTSSYFDQGQVAMMISSSGGTSYANTVNFTVGVAPAPYSLEQAYVSQGPSICFFSNSTWEERYAAWLFYRFCTSAQNSAYIATSSSGYDPVRQSSYTCDYYTDWLESNADSLFGRASQVTRSISEHTFYTDVFPGSATCRTQVGNIIGNVFLNTNDLPIDELIDKTFTDAYNQCIAAI